MNNRIVQHRGAEIHDRRTAQHRNILAGFRARDQPLEDFFLRQIPFAQIFFNQIIAGFSHGFNQLFPHLGNFILQVRGDFFFLHLMTVGYRDNGFLCHQVHHASKIRLLADRIRNWYTFGLKRLLNLFQNGFKIRSFFIQLVDKHKTGKFPCLNIIPDPIQFRAYARSTYDQHGAVCHVNGILGIGKKVQRSRSVEQVQEGLFVFILKKGRIHGMTMLNLFCFEIGHGISVGARTH